MVPVAGKYVYIDPVNDCDELYTTLPGAEQPIMLTWAPHNGACVVTSAANSNAVTPRTTTPLPRRGRGESSEAARPQGSDDVDSLRVTWAEAVVGISAVAAAPPPPKHGGCSLRLTPQAKGAKSPRAAQLQLQLQSPSRAQGVRPWSVHPPAPLSAARDADVAGMPCHAPAASAAREKCTRAPPRERACAAAARLSGFASYPTAPVDARRRATVAGLAQRATAATRRACALPRPATGRRRARAWMSSGTFRATLLYEHGAGPPAVKGLRSSLFLARDRPRAMPALRRRCFATVRLLCAL